MAQVIYSNPGKEIVESSQSPKNDMTLYALVFPKKDWHSREDVQKWIDEKTYGSVGTLSADSSSYIFKFNISNPGKVVYGKIFRSGGKKIIPQWVLNLKEKPMKKKVRNRKRKLAPSVDAYTSGTISKVWKRFRELGGRSIQKSKELWRQAYDEVLRGKSTGKKGVPVSAKTSGKRKKRRKGRGSLKKNPAQTVTYSRNLKVTSDVFNFVRKNANVKATELVGMVRAKYGVRLSPSTIYKIKRGEYSNTFVKKSPQVGGKIMSRRKRYPRTVGDYVEDAVEGFFSNPMTVEYGLSENPGISLMKGGVLRPDAKKMFDTIFSVGAPTATRIAEVLTAVANKLKYSTYKRTTKRKGVREYRRIKRGTGTISAYTVKKAIKRYILDSCTLKGGAYTVSGAKAAVLNNAAISIGYKSVGTYLGRVNSALKKRGLAAFKPYLKGKRPASWKTAYEAGRGKYMSGLGAMKLRAPKGTKPSAYETMSYYKPGGRGAGYVPATVGEYIDADVYSSNPFIDAVAELFSNVGVGIASAKILGVIDSKWLSNTGFLGGDSKEPWRKGLVGVGFYAIARVFEYLAESRMSGRAYDITEDAAKTIKVVSSLFAFSGIKFGTNATPLVEIGSKVGSMVKVDYKYLPEEVEALVETEPEKVGAVVEDMDEGDYIVLD